MQIRAAVAGDYDAYARLMPELGNGDPIPSRERFAAEIAERMLVAIDGDAIVGYSLVEQLADTGYVRNIVTDPKRRQRGIGRALMDAMRARFVAAGATTWCLNVKPDNTAARALYERCGLSPAYRGYATRVPREAVLPPVPADVSLVAIEPSEDAVVEPAFGLLRGQLANARSRSSRRVLGQRRGGAVVGVAVFMDSIPGAFPFRVVEPALGLALLAQLRPFVPDASYLQVGVEDDEPLQAALLAAGAFVQFDSLHMSGPLRA